MFIRLLVLMWSGIDKLVIDRNGVSSALICYDVVQLDLHNKTNGLLLIFLVRNSIFSTGYIPCKP